MITVTHGDGSPACTRAVPHQCSSRPLAAGSDMCHQRVIIRDEGIDDLQWSARIQCNKQREVDAPASELDEEIRRG